jgi:type IV secretion system protein VirD4
VNSPVSLKWYLAQLQAASAKNNHGIFLGINKDTYNFTFARPQRSVMVLGPTRSGKTSSIIIPSILAANGPVVSTSTKLDVLSRSFNGRGLLGRCFLFDPLGHYCDEIPQSIIPASFSPLQACDTWENSLLTAYNMVKSVSHLATNPETSHWLERAQALLAPVMYAFKLSTASMESVVTSIFSKDLKRVGEILTTLADPLPAMTLKSVLSTSERELAGIFSTASNVLAAYKSRKALERAKHPNFNIQHFVQSTDTVYIAAPSDEQHLVAPIISCFIERIKAETFKTFNQRSTSNHETYLKKAPVFFALDEIANIAPLASFEQIVTEGGGQGISMLACFQDLSQAAKTFGPPAERFLNLFPTKVIFPGIMDLRTLKILSELSGEKRVPSYSYHKPRGLNLPFFTNKISSSVTVSLTKEPVLKTSEISKINKDLILIHQENESPQFLLQASYFKHPLLKQICQTQLDLQIESDLPGL